jgi:hypothetical protein
MKKIAVYTFAAALLGIIIMLAPFVLFAREVSITGTDAQPQRLEPLQEAPSETEKMYGISPATYPSEVLFITLTLVLSFVIALRVRRFFMKKFTF